MTLKKPIYVNIRIYKKIFRVCKIKHLIVLKYNALIMVME